MYIAGQNRFGAVEGVWNLPDYSLEEMLKDNIIFCSALFRKSDWELVGGYDPEMKYGWEDYDFWLSLIERGRKVLQLDEYLFFYRVAPDSMVRSKEKWQKVAMFKRIYHKHSTLIGENIEVWLDELVESKERYFLSKLYVNCGTGFNESDISVCKVDKGVSQLNFDISGFEGRVGLRFDPVDCPTCVEIESVELHGLKKNVRLDLYGNLTNASCVDECLLMFATDDPQVFFNTRRVDLSKVHRVTVRLSYKCFDEEALHRIIECQTTLLANFLTGGNFLNKNNSLKTRDECRKAEE